jgi:signal transduction histidine kinase
MIDGSNRGQGERVLIFTPFGRDAALIQKEIEAAGLQANICSSIQELTEAITEGAGVALIADEALRPDAVQSLRVALAKQPPWSDFPLVIMTSGGDATEASRYRLRLLEPLGNVNLLERPVRVPTLISTLQAALRARRHQYQLATYLEERAQHERETASKNSELVKANRELEEFAYVSAHDLQEPLRMINIYSQMLISRFAGEDEKARTYAGFIEGGVKRMEKLLDDLLTYSRVINPNSSVVETADLNEALSQAMTTLNVRIRENSAHIEYQELPTVVGDQSQLTQVFQNLLSNALKYRRNDVPPKIVIAAERQGLDWVVSVRDNGIGFEQQHAERIFGLFKRLHKDEYPGTGLGLAICQRIIERCGGRMWAEGRPGEGSTFYFALPGGECTGDPCTGKSENGGGQGGS